MNQYIFCRKFFFFQGNGQGLPSRCLCIGMQSEQQFFGCHQSICLHGNIKVSSGEQCACLHERGYPYLVLCSIVLSIFCLRYMFAVSVHPVLVLNDRKDNCGLRLGMGAHLTAALEFVVFWTSSSSPVSPLLNVTKYPGPLWASMDFINDYAMHPSRMFHCVVTRVLLILRQQFVCHVHWDMILIQCSGMYVCKVFVKFVCRMSIFFSTRYNLYSEPLLACHSDVMDTRSNSVWTDMHVEANDILMCLNSQPRATWWICIRNT